MHMTHSIPYHSFHWQSLPFGCAPVIHSFISYWIVGEEGVFVRDWLVLREMKWVGTLFRNQVKGKKPGGDGAWKVTWVSKPNIYVYTNKKGALIINNKSNRLTYNTQNQQPNEWYIGQSFKWLLQHCPPPPSPPPKSHS
jgi:hypothetical protein